MLLLQLIHSCLLLWFLLCFLYLLLCCPLLLVLLLDLWLINLLCGRYSSCIAGRWRSLHSQGGSDASVHRISISQRRYQLLKNISLLLLLLLLLSLLLLEGSPPSACPFGRYHGWIRWQVNCRWRRCSLLLRFCCLAV